MPGVKRPASKKNLLSPGDISPEKIVATGCPTKLHNKMRACVLAGQKMGTTVIPEAGLGYISAMVGSWGSVVSEL